LYGVIDIGLQYDTRAAPVSDSFIFGTAEVIQKNSRMAILALTPSNSRLSQIGLKGDEHLIGDWSGVFELTTPFVPQSGELVDCLKSVVANNGTALTAQATGVDCSLAGQLFGRAAYAGLSSKTSGTLTLGRQRALLADGIVEYDPVAAPAFSPIAFSGISGGGTGSPENYIVNSALKYVATLGPLKVGGFYQFRETGGNPGSGLQFQLGANFARASVDAFYAHKNDATFATSLSAEQVAALPALGYSANSVAARVSDNTAYVLVGRYSFGRAKLFAGYERIQFANPSHPLAAGYDDIGGYTIAFPDNTAYNHRVVQVTWAGMRYELTSRLNLALAYYGYLQNSSATGVNAGCTSRVAADCSGSLNALSLLVDQEMSRHIDFYAGTMWTSVADGLASGYLNTSNLATTVGVRLTF
jgi:predicted porin